MHGRYSPLVACSLSSSDTCVHVVTRPVAAGSDFASLDLMFGPRARGQGGLEGTVVEMVHSKSQVVAAVDQMKGHLYM